MSAVIAALYLVAVVSVVDTLLVVLLWWQTRHRQDFQTTSDWPEALSLPVGDPAQPGGWGA